MADLKDMTVQALRDLARKALGRGHSKLKTKRELVEALEAAGAKPVASGVAPPGSRGPAAERPRSGAKAARSGVAGAEPPMSKPAGHPSARSDRARAGGSSAPLAPKAQPPAAGPEARRSQASGTKPPRSRSAKRPSARPGRARADGSPAGVAPDAQPRAGARRVGAAGTEPDPEGYMVARVLGEEALRGAPHPMTESALESARKPAPLKPSAAVAGLDEVLGELPWSYGEDVLVALPRDPTTLFCYWDHAPETLRQAWAGLDGGRPQLRILVRERGGEWTSARTVEIALESRSYYVHDLAPGRVYRAEIHLVDRTGRDALLAQPSNDVQLPTTGPSPVVDDRFMALPWSEPLQRLLREAHAGGPFSEDLRAQLARLSDWSRFTGRAWGGWGASAGGMGGRPFSPVSSPTSPAGSAGRPDWKGR